MIDYYLAVKFHDIVNAHDDEKAASRSARPGDVSLMCLFFRPAQSDHLLEAAVRVDAMVATIFRVIVVATRANIMIDHIQ